MVDINLMRGKILISRLTLLLFLLMGILCSGQTKKIKGNWISADQEFMSIVDTAGNYNTLLNRDLLDEQFFLFIYGDTLSFQSHYTSSAENFTVEHNDRYDLKILSFTDSFLTVSPATALAKYFFYNKSIIRFMRQEYDVDTAFRFEKLVYHTTECFGSCPIIDLELNSNRQIRCSARNAYNFAGNGGLDSSLIGDFSGLLPHKEFDTLMLLLKTAGLRTLKYRPQFCCDAPVTTLIVYSNGERKYIKSMFLPPHLYTLIGYLYRLNRKAILVRSRNKIKLED